MDKAHKQTDKILNNLEKELEGVYKDAYISISKKMEDLLKKIDLDLKRQYTCFYLDTFQSVAS